MKILNSYKNFYFRNIDICNNKKLVEYFKKKKFKYVYHLAAQAGVRYSLKNPRNYLNSNIIGFFNLLEQLKNKKPENFIFASSSSVYGNNITPFKETQSIKKPISFYSTTKISNELFAENFSKIYGIKTICLRLFTVYGPFGRPDMAIFKFFESFYKRKNIFLRDNGNHQRDYTYIDDVSDAMLNCIKKKFYSKLGLFEIFNLGNSKPISTINLLRKIKHISKLSYPKIITVKSIAESKKTKANILKAKRKLNFKNTIKIDTGLNIFNEWFKKRYKI